VNEFDSVLGRAVSLEMSQPKYGYTRPVALAVGAVVFVAAALLVKGHLTKAAYLTGGAIATAGSAYCFSELELSKSQRKEAWKAVAHRLDESEVAKAAAGRILSSGEELSGKELLVRVRRAVCTSQLIPRFIKARLDGTRQSALSVSRASLKEALDAFGQLPDPTQDKTLHRFFGSSQTSS